MNEIFDDVECTIAFGSYRIVYVACSCKMLKIMSYSRRLKNNDGLLPV